MRVSKVFRKYCCSGTTIRRYVNTNKSNVCASSLKGKNYRIKRKCKHTLSKQTNHVQIIQFCTNSSNNPITNNTNNPNNNNNKNTNKKSSRHLILGLCAISTILIGYKYYSKQSDISEKYPIASDNLRYWTCSECNHSKNALFDSRCNACSFTYPFNKEHKSKLISLCIEYSNKDIGWNEFPENAFEIELLSGGLSNKLYKISVTSDTHLKQLNDPRYAVGVLRIFNHRIGLNKDQLLSVYQTFAESKLGTMIFGNFDIGQIEEFINGHQLESDKKSILNTEVAEIMSSIHALKPPHFDDSEAAMIGKLKENITTVSNMHEHFGKELAVIGSETHEKWKFVLDDYEKFGLKNDGKLDAKVFAEIMNCEVQWIVQQLESGENKSHFCDIVFSHNDFHSGNMLSNERTGKVTIIDYEFSGYNYRCFDFGNCFCELSVDNFYSEKPGFKMMPEMYPSMDERKKFIGDYLRKSELTSVVSIDDDVRCIQFGCLLSHLMWTMWGIIESQRNDPDWDYAEYGRQRLIRYFIDKNALINA